MLNCLDSYNSLYLLSVSINDTTKDIVIKTDILAFYLRFKRGLFIRTHSSISHSSVVFLCSTSLYYMYHCIGTAYNEGNMCPHEREEEQWEIIFLLLFFVLKLFCCCSSSYYQHQGQKEWNRRPKK